MAASSGHTDTVVELMKEGADIHIQNEVCCVSLHLTLYVYMGFEYQVLFGFFWRGAICPPSDGLWSIISKSHKLTKNKNYYIRIVSISPLNFRKF